MPKTAVPTSDQLVRALDALGVPGVADSILGSVVESDALPHLDLHLINALYGVVERMMSATETAAIEASDPDGDDDWLHHALKQQAHAGALVDRSDAAETLLDALYKRIRNTIVTLWDVVLDPGALGEDISAREALVAAAFALRAAGALCAGQAGVQGYSVALECARGDLAGAAKHLSACEPA